MTDLESVIDRSRRLSPRAKVIYLDGVRRFLAFAGRDPRQWTGVAAEKWRDDMKARGLRATTVNVRLSGLRYASRRLADLDMGRDFARAAETLPTDWRPRRVLTLQEARRLVAACLPASDPAALRDRAALLLGMRASLRCAEILGVTKGSVAPRGGALAVRRKGGKEQRVRLDGETQAALGAWLGWLTREGLRDGPIFRRLRQRLDGSYEVLGVLTPDGFRRMVKARGEAAGLRGVHPHALRHTYCSIALASGVPLGKVALRAGHADPKTTMRYLHEGVLREDEEAADELPSMG